MEPNVERTFIYHANALAIGGTFRRPVQRVVNVPAASTLPREGGYGTARVGPYRFEEFLSFQAAYTQVSGSQDPKDGSYTTLASATVEGLNVLDVLTADRVVAQLASKYQMDDEEPEIVPLGSRIDNLRIAGRPVKVDLDLELFTRLCTYRKFEEHFKADTAFREQAASRYEWESAQTETLPESEGVVRCSLLREAAGLDSSVEHRGYRIRVPQFGTIYIGEAFLSRKKRRFILLRLELGSPVEASLSMGDIDGNGSPFP